MLYYSMMKRIHTELELVQLGIPTVEYDKFQIYPIIEVRPTYNAYLEKLVAEDVPRLIDNGISRKYYEQHYYKEPLTDIELYKAYTSLLAESKKSLFMYVENITKEYLENFSSVEKLTWNIQQTEIEAWLKDASSPTPTLDALATYRGISREEMLQKTSVKIQTFKHLIPIVIGQQQMYEDKLKEIEDDSEKSTEQKIEAIQALIRDIRISLSTNETEEPVEEITTGNYELTEA